MHRTRLPAITVALVAIGFAVMFVSTAVKGLYQVYFIDLATHFGQGRAQFAWSGSVFMLATGLMSPVVGAFSDRVGPLRTAAAGALAAGIALGSAALWPGSLTFFVLMFGLAGAFGLAAMTFVPMGILVDRLFEERRKGLAYAVVTNGTAIGFVVLSPLWIWLQPQAGWITAFGVAGAVFALPVAGALWLASRWEPASAPAPRTAEADVPAWTVVRRDPVFYALAAGFFGCGATMAFIDVHLIAYWQGQGVPRLAMGYAMSTLGALELASGLVSGALALSWDKHRLLAAFYALRSASMLLLLVPGLGVLPFAVGFGASYLGTVILTSMFCFERYGSRIKGKVFGLLFLGHQLGAFLTVQLGAWSFDATRSYQHSITALVAVTLCSAACSWFGLRRAGPLPALAKGPAHAAVPEAASR
ncbi:putative MFS-type transporter [Cupriavidus necator H850]|jgi:MFS family permease|uniref:MFS transporter n=1 Tax=Cupriavidus TaxID=106589 RepID=UPI00129E46D3|nr:MULTISPECIES: MFS transporter [Cupriavidus]KAI3605649.1 putative MFS-type transporter [Cupriavidus necator H850]QUN28664.1 MFS transporter [Cupriavidus sp. KK10]